MVSQCDQKYSLYDFFAFSCDNLSQPSVTYRNARVTNALLRFILADVPFQNMSLNEQYSDEEQRSSKHENCRHINLIITIFANFRKCI